MRCWIILLLAPTLLWAQEFEFRQEFDTIPVEIDGWEPYCPWVGGFSRSTLCFKDVDADGDFDLFVGGATRSIAHANNTGSSSSPHLNWISYQYDSLISVNSVGNSDPNFWDLDADGDLDAIIGAGYVTYVENLGTFSYPQFISVPETVYTTTSVVVATRIAMLDIDLDLDADIVAGYTGYLILYENIGTPTQFSFQLASSPWLTINVGDKADPTFCDIDDDNDQDLFIGNEDGQIYFYHNDGDSANYNFTFVTDHYNGIDVGDFSSPEFADIDGDGDYDLFVGRDQLYDLSISPGDIFLYENVGTPQVAQWQLVTRNYLSIDVGYLGQMAATDIDADGDRDLFIQNTGDHVSFYENIGTPAAPSYHWVTDSYQNIAVDDAYPCFADIDNDQDPDLFMGQAAIPGPPGLHLFINQGTPQSADFTLYSNNLLPGVFTQGSVSLAPSLADIDADGDLDLFVSDMDDHYYFFLNTGSPSQFVFSLQSSNWQGITAVLSFPSFFYDIDEDGDLDLFLSPANDLNLMFFYRNVGSPQTPQMVLETSNFLPMTGIQLCYGIDVSDLDQDEDGDFLLSTGSGGMLFFRNITGEESAPPPVYRHPQAGMQISLGQNPANPNTVISFVLPFAQQVDLAVYNLLGARVITLASGLTPPGSYVVPWNATANASGVYIIRLKTPQAAVSEKLTIVK
ncbi:MAG TPA: T9SS type A sorting domain-containing protein [bacterium]|jgi:hypothetical protein